jgi:lipid A 4'-phosphatase
MRPLGPLTLASLVRTQRIKDPPSGKQPASRLSPMQTLWLTLTVLSAGALLIFALFPGIDLAVSSLFVDANKSFVGKESGVIIFARDMFRWIFTAVCMLSVAGLIATRDWRSLWLSLTFAQWLFLGACLGAGPGLVANIGLKDHWGRARPATVVEFGGTRIFTSVPTISKQCDRNCSFVSGEASSIFMMFFAAAFLFPWDAGLFWAGGVVCGGLAGLVRMADGGHFLSDVIFAGLLMAMTAAALDYAFRAIVATSASPIDAPKVV